MRIVVANCSVDYSGRGQTHLPYAVRALLIKADGSVSIHADLNGNKPLNYMGAPCVLTIRKRGRSQVWVFENKKESIQVRIRSIISDETFHLDGTEPGLARTGTEHELQAWIAEHPYCLGDSVQFIQREYRTGAGAVDLLMRDELGFLAVEVKRVASLGSVDQVLRYVDALNAHGELGVVRGVIAALDIRPTTAAQALRRGVECITVPTPEWGK